MAMYGKWDAKKVKNGCVEYVQALLWTRSDLCVVLGFCFLHMKYPIYAVNR